MEKLKLELIEVIIRCPDVKSFRFKTKGNMSFKPGQYLILTLNIKGKDVSKVFSISSSPTEKGFIEFTKKIGASDFSGALKSLEVGKDYLLQLPMGNFTFEGEFQKAAFLSGGIGITPIRSIFKNASDRHLGSSMILLYSSRTPEYLIFKDDFDCLQKSNKNLKVVYTITDSRQNIGGYRLGYINEEFIKEQIPDYRERVFFICGPPAMVEAMRSILVNGLGVRDKQVKTEDFLGY